MNGMRAASATALCLLLASAGGCAKVIGLDSFSETDEPAEGARGQRPGATGPSCDLPGISRSCANCLHTACESECRGCDGNRECEAILDCTGDCASGDLDCFGACLDDHPSGARDFLNLYADTACAFTTCKLACLGRRGNLLEPCNLGEQCASGLCTLRSGGWCTTQCTSSAECGAGGGCIRLTDGPSVCFPACASDNDCFPGLRCVAATDVSGVQGSVCVQ